MPDRLLARIFCLGIHARLSDIATLELLPLRRCDVGDIATAAGVDAASFLRAVVPADWTDRPAPDPAQFGLPTEDDGSREDPMLGRGHIVNTTGYEPRVFPPPVDHTQRG
jgi:hypothetical protein